MIISVFKKDYIPQLLFITVISVLLWLKAFLHPELLPVNIEPYSLFYGPMAFFAANHMTAAVIISFFMILLQGLFLNYILAYNKLSNPMSLFPMFIYVVLMSVQFKNQTFTPMLFTNMFLLMSLHNMLQCYNQSVSYEKIFNASFCLSLTFLFYFPATYLIVLMILVLVIYRLYHWRKWVVMILGIIAPFFAVFTYFFLTDGLETVFSALSSKMLRITPSVSVTNVGEVCISAIFLIFIFVSSFASVGQFSDNVIIYRKKTTIILLLFLLGIVFSLYETILPLNLQNFAIPMTFTMMVFFLSQNKSKVSNTVFIIFLITSFASIYLFP